MRISDWSSDVCSSDLGTGAGRTEGGFFLMSLPLMPKATAVWLIDNTSLSFEQVAQFCGLHPLEVQGIADGEVATGIQGMDPVLSGELTRDEIKRCEADPTARLAMAKSDLPQPTKRTKGPRYTPVAKRIGRAHV